MSDFYEQLALQHGFKLTSLRKDILQILAQVNLPLGAYAILEILRKTRQSAEPPTVYRVLEFLEKQNVVHRLSHNNTYILCQNLDHEHQTSIVFTCKKCQHSAEFIDSKISNYLARISVEHHIILENQVLEVTGECKNCSKQLTV